MYEFLYEERGVVSVNLLEVKSISKVYGEGDTAVHALKKVSFSVPKGEFVAERQNTGSLIIHLAVLPLRKEYPS